MGRRVCLFFIGVYLLLYLAALGAAIIGTRGMFGLTADGLSAVYLVVLGFPWTLVLAFIGSVPESLGRIFVGLAPILNIAVALWVCRRRKRRYYQ